MTPQQPTGPIDLVDGKHLLRLVRGLPRSGNLRVWAEASLAGEALPTDVIPELCRVIRGSDRAIWQHRLVASRILIATDWRNNYRDEVCDALQTVTDTAVTMKDRSRIAVAQVAAGLLLACTLLTIVGTMAMVIVQSPEMRWLTLTVTCGLFAGIIYGVAGAVSASMQVTTARALTRRLSIRMLGELGDVRALGEVAGAALDLDLDVSSEARQVLPGLLNALRLEHYGTLDWNVVPALCGLLDCTDRALVVVTLGALERAGDGRAAECVRRQVVASTQAIRWHGEESCRNRDPEDLEAANRALPILEERLRNETAAERLLRPAARPDDAASVLLRPAGSASAVPDEQLLRPADAEVTVHVERSQ